MSRDDPREVARALAYMDAEDRDTKAVHTDPIMAVSRRSGEKMAALSGSDGAAHVSEKYNEARSRADVGSQLSTTGEPITAASLFGLAMQCRLQTQHATDVATTPPRAPRQTPRFREAG